MKRESRKKRLYQDNHEDKDYTIFWNIDKMEAYIFEEFARIDAMMKSRRKRTKKLK